MIVEGVYGSVKVGSDNSMDSCPIGTQGTSTNTDSIREAMHNWLWRVWNYGKKIRSFLYKNLLFHRGKQDPKWSSGVLYCSLLLIWWKDRKLSKKNNEIVSLRSNPQDKEHFCLPNTKTGLKPCGFASRKVVWQKSITSLFWCLEYFIS